MRVVLDTNVFISGIFWKGDPYRVLEAWWRGSLTNFTSLSIIGEITKVLQSKKFSMPDDDAYWWRLAITDNSVVLDEDLLKNYPVRDQTDNKILRCGVAGNVWAIAYKMSAFSVEDCPSSTCGATRIVFSENFEGNNLSLWDSFDRASTASPALRAIYSLELIRSGGANGFIEKAIDLSIYSNVSVEIIWSNGTGSGAETLSLDVSTNSGASWTTVASLDGTVTTIQSQFVVLPACGV